jgi:uncharacterized glyoxalase superfamily protein PhnB
MPLSFSSVVIIVNNLTETLAFYRLLGLPVSEGVENEPYVDVIDKNNFHITFVPLTTVQESTPDWKDRGTGNRMSLHYKCATVAKLNSTYTKLIAAGYTSEMQPHDALWGERFAQVLDPDGNVISLFASLTPDIHIVSSK